MRKFIFVLLCGMMLTGCAMSGEGETNVEESQVSTDMTSEANKENINQEFPSSEQLLLALKSKNPNLIDIDVFDENTDPNGKLGRPGYYISKADFSDSRIEQVGEYLCGGTIETFLNTKDCEKRTEYLKSLAESGTGVIAVNQYIYPYDLVLFRVDYDLTPKQAEEYRLQMAEILEQYEKTGSLNIEEASGESQVSSTNNDAFDAFKNSIIENAKDFEVTDENSKSFFEIAIKTSEEVSKLKSSEITESQLFNAFALAAGYLCNNFDDGTDYGRVGELAFELIRNIALDDESGKESSVAKIKAFGAEYDMEVQTLLDESESESETTPSSVAAESIQLSTGKYIVGEDIPAGKYDIIGVEQGNVHVCSQGKDYGDVVNEIIKPGEVTYANVRLEDGYTVEVVLGGKIELQLK